jgi:hypothetical protein
MKEFEKTTFLETCALLWGGAIGWVVVLTLYFWIL